MDEHEQQPYKRPTAKRPTLRRIEQWDAAGYCRATDGCRVEPDGWCSHGHVSWLLYLGLI